MKLIHTAINLLQQDNGRVAKVYWDATIAEYIVKLIVRGKHYVPADYFTTDKDDALATSQSMVS